MLLRLAWLALAVATCDAYVVTRVGHSIARASNVHTSTRDILMMPTPAPAPATKTKTRTVTKPKTGGPSKPAQQQKVHVAKPKRATESAYVPMWKVLLLGDEDYEEDPVVGVIREVLPDIPMDEIREKYHQAQATGDSLLTVVNQEHAEAFVSQFHRATPMVFADAQPE
mmetsp:Transcript_874/g.2473  ORF Transcript_874/g.2473 Transcript_874/m.2473 type:complete len:169 (-) Transcript_874:89-595(-)